MIIQFNMFNSTIFVNELANKTSEEVLKITGELFLPSILIIWFAILLITIIIALATIKRGWSNFFLIFILPNIIFLVLILFVFRIPILPEWTASWITGWLSG